MSKFVMLLASLATLAALTIGCGDKDGGDDTAAAEAHQVL